MKLLYENRNEQDKKFIYTVCDDILSKPYTRKQPSDKFAAVFVEGRDRVCCLEDLAAISSFNVFSKYNYPVFCFVHNEEFFAAVSQNEILKSRINVIKIPKIESLEEYTKFCIDKLYFMLPDYVDNVITLQPDGMLLKEGWEDFILSSQVDWLSPHWRHFAGIEVFKESKGWDWPREEFFPTCIGNGGFSYRRASKMKIISSGCAFNKIHQRERGRADNRIPMEDLFYCFWGFNSSVMRAPNLKQCDDFALDPLTPKVYFSDNKPFGFHFFKDLSEPDAPPCNHIL